MFLFTCFENGSSAFLFAILFRLCVCVRIYTHIIPNCVYTYNIVERKNPTDRRCTSCLYLFEDLFSAYMYICCIHNAHTCALVRVCMSVRNVYANFRFIFFFFFYSSILFFSLSFLFHFHIFCCIAYMSRLHLLLSLSRVRNDH